MTGLQSDLKDCFPLKVQKAQESTFQLKLLKGVVNTKFRISRIIDPPWFVTNKKARRLFKNLTYYQINNSNINFLKLIFAALV